MTNGEKLCTDFPNMRYTISEHRVITTIGVAASFDLEWWNAEYKEPTTQERQVESDKYDAAFQDGYDNGYAQARFDYEQKSILDTPLRAEIEVENNDKRTS